MYKISGDINVDPKGQELRLHGTLAYPIACYYNDMSIRPTIWHWHEELELIVVKEGAVKVAAGSAEEILNEGDGCFINSDVAHSVWQIDSKTGVINSIVFHPKLIGSRHSIYWQKYIGPLIENKSQQFILFDSKQLKDNKIIGLVQSAWQAEADERPGFEFEVRSLLSQLIFLISEGRGGTVYIQTPKELRDMERTKLMITFLENHFTDNVNLEQISKAAMISDSECLRCFKRVTGSSPIQFLKEYRLLRAAELIKTTKLKISDIAEQCGFLDMSYFAKSFREAFKQSPTIYRKNF